MSGQIPWPGVPWACGHSELARGCTCGDTVAVWWAQTLRKIAESHGEWDTRTADVAKNTRTTSSSTASRT